MNHSLRRFFAALLCIVICLSCIPPAIARAEEAEQSVPEAEDISAWRTLTECVRISNADSLFDKRPLYGTTAEAGAYFTAEHPEGIGSVYIIFQLEYVTYTVTNNDTGEVAEVGQERFLHHFIDLEELFGGVPHSVTVHFPETARINEVYLFTPGQVPDFVQKWETPRDNETDLILFSTHGDDEHLFFAGILPYYGVELDYQVQVVYLTDHRSYATERIHEMLNGLWAIGIKTYPVYHSTPDFRFDSVEQAYHYYEITGYTRESLLGYVVEQMRRFKPKVVVTHDFEGEYGHAMHIVYAELVAEALQISNDPEMYPELADIYGLWDVPKAYFHLYPENEIFMDWDRPLERYDGKTAFEVSIHQGFQCHLSQISDFAWYYTGYSDAASLPLYNPCYYGLYRSTVGPDVEKNDFFENVTTYGQDRKAEEDRLAEEARLKAQAEEEARLAAEEKAKQQAEEQARQEAKERQEAEALKEADEAARKAAKTRTTVLMIMAVMAAGYVLLGYLTRDKKKC